MPIVQVGDVRSSTSSATVSFAWKGNTTSGNGIVGAVTWDNGNGAFLVSVKDSLNNNCIILDIVVDSVHSQVLASFFVSNIVGGTRPTLTAAFSKSTTFRGLVAHEVSEVDTVNLLDSHNALLVSSPGLGIDAVNSGTILVSDQSYVFSAVIASAGSTSVTTGTGFTRDTTDNNSGVDLASEHLVKLGNGNQSGTWTATQNSAHLVAMVALKILSGTRPKRLTSQKSLNLTVSSAGSGSDPSLQGILLEDFATNRNTADGTQALFQLYSPGGQTQTGGYDGTNHRFTTTCTGISAGPSGGAYVQAFLRGDTDAYSFPNGFQQHYIKSGVWASTVNRMRFRIKRDAARASDGLHENFEVGNYAKSHNYSDTSQQGQHFYWISPGGFFANEWIFVFLDPQVQHIVGGNANENQPYDFEFNAPDGFAPTPTHFMDALTRMYFDGGPDSGTADLNKTYIFDDYYFNTEDDSIEPIASLTGSGDTGARLIKLVSTCSVTYDPTANSAVGGYEVCWAAPKNLSQSFQVAYKTSSMKASGGWSSGTTTGGTITNDGSAYTGCRWNSLGLARQTMYFGIKPTNNNPSGYFSEFWYVSKSD